MTDAVLGGETDPVALCYAYFNGATLGGIFSTLLCCSLVYIATGGAGASLLQAALGVALTNEAAQSFNGALDSFANGNYVQGFHRTILSFLSSSGAAKFWGEALLSINSNQAYFKIDSAKGSMSDKSKLIDGKKAYSLSDKEARQWYINKEKTIPDLIDHNSPLESQAKQAFILRNKFRTQARELMANRNAAEYLAKNEPNMTWEQIIKKYKQKGFEGDELYNKIIDSSQKSRETVNKYFGVK